MGLAVIPVSAGAAAAGVSLAEGGTSAERMEAAASAETSQLYGHGHEQGSSYDGMGGLGLVDVDHVYSVPE